MFVRYTKTLFDTLILSSYLSNLRTSASTVVKSTNKAISVQLSPIGWFFGKVRLLSETLNQLWLSWNFLVVLINKPNGKNLLLKWSKKHFWFFEPPYSPMFLKDKLRFTIRFSYVCKFCNYSTILYDLPLFWNWR